LSKPSTSKTVNPAPIWCGVNRIIDANINRAKEGLRVCEEIARFIINSRSLTSDFKKIRHEVESTVKRLPSPLMDLLKERKSLTDVGKNIYANELERRDTRDIFYANIQRAKESIRVLEEFTKLINIKCAVSFKKIRYNIYEIEKRTAKKITALYNH
jgi:thiamine-phosphate pyrophosphorylase